MSNSPLKLQLALRGRPIRDFTFFQETVTIGRNAQADVFLDNRGVSRDQARIHRRPEGWVLCDSRSANGTWLNRRKVEQEPLKDRDEIEIGKFTMRVRLEPDAAVRAIPTRRPATAATEVDGTTFLTRGQLASILESAEEPGAERLDPFPVGLARQAGSAPRWLRNPFLLVILFALAMAAGAALTALLMR